MTTDACEVGWGGWWGEERKGGGKAQEAQQGDEETPHWEAKGVWGPLQVHSINPLELMAGLEMLKRAERRGELRKGMALAWETDNSTVVWGVRKWKSGSDEMRKGLLEVRELVDRWGLKLVVRHIAGKNNERADQLSRWALRNVDEGAGGREWGEWKLNPLSLRVVCHRLEWEPTVDAFASQATAQVARWWSYGEEGRGEEARDALARPWGAERLWAYPPPALLTKVLAKCRAERATILLAVPPWPAQVWWPMWQEMRVGRPMALWEHPERPLHLLIPGRRAPAPPTASTLIISLVSGHPRRRAAHPPTPIQVGGRGWVWVGEDPL
jgi:ribonuclease HI